MEFVIGGIGTMPAMVYLFWVWAWKFMLPVIAMLLRQGITLVNVLVWCRVAVKVVIDRLEGNAGGGLDAWAPELTACII